MAKLKEKTRQYRGGLALEAQAFPSFGATIPHALTLDDIVHPAFWHTQSRTLEPGAWIRCEWECRSRSVWLRVMGVDEHAREVLVLVEEAREFPPPPIPDGFELEFVNAGVGWRILEEGRRAPRRGGFATSYAAAKWLLGDRGEDPAPELKAVKAAKPAAPAKQPKAASKSEPERVEA